MKDYIVGVVSLIVGIVTICFKSKLAKSIIDEQNKFWGFHFGQKTIRHGDMFLLLFGLCLILFGLLAFFHIIRIR